MKSYHSSPSSTVWADFYGHWALLSHSNHRKVWTNRTHITFTNHNHEQESRFVHPWVFLGAIGHFSECKFSLLESRISVASLFFRPARLIVRFWALKRFSWRYSGMREPKQYCGSYYGNTHTHERKSRTSKSFLRLSSISVSCEFSLVESRSSVVSVLIDSRASEICFWFSWTFENTTPSLISSYFLLSSYNIQVTGDTKYSDV